jgi:hypothetical protein
MGKRRASPPPASATPGGGRAWWAHLDFTRVNIHPIIVRNQIEELMNVQGIGEQSFLKIKPLVVIVPARGAER